MTAGAHATIYPSAGSLRYDDIDDPNGIKTTIATVAGAASYSGGAINGALASSGPTAPALTKMHRLSVTTAANASTYVVGSTITYTCTDQFGKPRFLIATVTNTNGGETLDAVLADGSDAGAMTVSQIDVEEQNDTSGAFEFGVTDVVFDQPARVIRGGAAGNIMVEFEADLVEDATVWADTWAIAFAGEKYPATFVKRIMDATTTAFPVTVFL